MCSNELVMKATKIIQGTPELYSARMARGITPTVTQSAWEVAPQNQTALTEQVLNQSLGFWFETVKLFEAIFKEKVYENPNITDVDIRMHCLSLCGLLFDGEQLALFHLIFGDQNKRLQEFQELIKPLDLKKAELLKTLIEWHGSIDAQADLPDDLKQAMREVQAGTLEDDDL
jgi:hypothetical protein